MIRLRLRNNQYADSEKLKSCSLVLARWWDALNENLNEKRKSKKTFSILSTILVIIYELYDSRLWFSQYTNCNYYKRSNYYRWKYVQYLTILYDLFDGNDDILRKKKISISREHVQKRRRQFWIVIWRSEGWNCEKVSESFNSLAIQRVITNSTELLAGTSNNRNEHVVRINYLPARKNNIAVSIDYVYIYTINAVRYRGHRAPVWTHYREFK